MSFSQFSYRALLSRLGAGILFSIFCVAITQAQNVPPKLTDVSIVSPIGEYGYTTLIGTIQDANPFDKGTLKINWGDGKPTEVYAYFTNVVTFTNYHVYTDRSVTNKPTDKYTVVVTVIDKRGAVFKTNLLVVVTNAFDVSLYITSPINQNAAPEYRGLDVTEFPIPTPGAGLGPMATGPDGAIWFTESFSNKIGRITTNGVITEFPLVGARQPLGITKGPDNRMWFACYASQQIGRISRNGAVKLFKIPRVAPEPGKFPRYITTVGENLWFTMLDGRLGQITTNGVITQYKYDGLAFLNGIAYGPDDALWFTDYFQDLVCRRDMSSGEVTKYALAAPAGPSMITRGPDNAMWFTEFQEGKIGRVSVADGVAEAGFGRGLPWGITTGPENALWFTRFRSNDVVRFQVNGDFSRFQLPFNAGPSEILNGPDGIWVTTGGRNSLTRLRYTTYGNVWLSGNIYDPGVRDSHTLAIDWGDGSAVERRNLKKNILTFNLTHQYTGAGPTYIVTVTVTDNDGGYWSYSFNVDINPPAAGALDSVLRLTSANFVSGQLVIDGIGADPGATILVQMAADGTNWTDLGITMAEPDGHFEFRDNAGAHVPGEYYRAIQQ